MAGTTPELNRVIRADLVWWLDKIPTLDWTFATTYAEGAPHEYVGDRTEGMTHEDFERAARVIRTFGHPQKFYKWTRTYLVDDAGWKYWDMEGDDVSTCNLINRGRADHIYGAQNAPATKSTVESPYDGLATFWDQEHGSNSLERTGITELVSSIGDFSKRRVLDIGCGTGLALDLAITQPVRYVGIDPSQGMLNELVRKHKTLAGVHPMTFTEALRRRVLGGTRFDLVLALGGAGSYLSPGDVREILLHARGPIVLTFYAHGARPPAGDLPAGAAAAHAAAHERAIEVRQVGRFEFVRIGSSPRA